jgi:hypothetical protein
MDGVYAIPIGMEAREWCSFDKFDVILETRRSRHSPPSGQLYGNFSVITNRQARLKCLSAFNGKPYFRNAIVQALNPAPELTELSYRKFCEDILDC